MVKKMQLDATSAYAITSAIVLISMLIPEAKAQGIGNEMVKMCLFYDSPSGHVRSDPIINQACASGHVHTFYGPKNFHPDTTYEDLINTPKEFSTSPFVENQSLYWHPSFYEVTNNGATFTRVSDLESSPYYRWDKSVTPLVEAFPPGFRMIAASSDAGAHNAMFTECCNFSGNGGESCQDWNFLNFPDTPCDFLGIALAMPTCWEGQQLGDTNNHKNHMAYTTDGTVAGDCPGGFNHRLPEIQFFIRINNYKGGTYQLSDAQTDFHVDFFNGWQDGVLQNIIDNCDFYRDQVADESGYNPPVSYTKNNSLNIFHTCSIVCLTL